MNRNLLLALPIIAIMSCNGPQQRQQVQPNDITGKYHLQALARPGEGAYLSSELIYPLEDKLTPECHASTIAETSSGLVAAFLPAHLKSIRTWVFGSAAWSMEIGTARIVGKRVVVGKGDESRGN